MDDIPYDRERCNAKNVECKFIGAAAIATALDANKLVESSNYYGIPNAWKTNNGYRCMLLQYCNVTEDKTFATAAEAAEWFEEMFRATE